MKNISGFFCIVQSNYDPEIKDQLIKNGKKITFFVPKNDKNVNIFCHFDELIYDLWVIVWLYYTEKPCDIFNTTQVLLRLSN